MDDSHVEVDKDTGKVKAYVGPDAVTFARVRMIKSSLKLHKSTGLVPTRGVTITKLFAMCHEYTGKTYKRKEHDKAIADLETWLSAMESAIPVKES